MEWLKNILGMASGVTNNGLYGAAETGTQYGQFLIKGVGKYNSAMTAVKAAANGDWNGTFAGIAGFMTKKAMDDSDTGTGWWSAAKSSLVGMGVEWLVKSGGVIGILAVLALGMFFKPVRDMIGGLFGGNKETAAAETQGGAAGSGGGRAVSGGESVSKNDVEFVHSHAEDLRKVKLAVNPQGQIIDINNGEKVSPSLAVQKIKAVIAPEMQHAS